MSDYRRVVIVEEHLSAGGFGSFVREQLEARPDLQQRIRCLSLDIVSCGLIGSPSFIRDAGGLTDGAIFQALSAD